MSHLKLNKPKLILSTILVMTIHNGYSQSNLPTENELTLYLILGLVCVIAMLVLLVATFVLHILRIIVRDNAIKKAKEKGIEYVPEPSLWQKLNVALTNAKPIEEEASIELDHNYDGIKELDNHLPPWWTYLFYLSIVFSIVYVFVYHVSESMPLQIEEYEQEMAMAAESKKSQDKGPKGSINETNVAFTDAPQDLANGQKIFTMQCAACHKENGAGGIGPNLTDDYWLHGGDVKSIFSTIKYGVPDKGMISWEPLLSPTQMRDVTSYIVTLKETDPLNSKGPQGELYVEKAMPADSTQSL